MNPFSSLITEILEHEGVATIVTNSVNGPHVTATWNSYIEQDEKDRFLIPAGGFHKTEACCNSGSQVIMLIGSKEVMGKESLGAGLRLTGNASFYSEGEEFEKTKKKFTWARAVLVFTINAVEQLQ